LESVLGTVVKEALGSLKLLCTEPIKTNPLNHFNNKAMLHLMY
jgi:hypothetical protein